MKEGDLKVAPTITGGFRGPFLRQGKHGYGSRWLVAGGEWGERGGEEAERRGKTGSSDAGKVKRRTPERFLSAFGMTIKGKPKFKGSDEGAASIPNEKIGTGLRMKRSGRGRHHVRKRLEAMLYSAFRKGFVKSGEAAHCGALP